MNQMDEKEIFTQVFLAMRKLQDLHQLSKEQNIFLKKELTRKRDFLSKFISQCNQNYTQEKLKQVILDYVKIQQPKETAQSYIQRKFPFQEVIIEEEKSSAPTPEISKYKTRIYKNETDIQQKFSQYKETILGIYKTLKKNIKQLPQCLLYLPLDNYLDENDSQNKDHFDLAFKKVFQELFNNNNFCILAKYVNENVSKNQQKQPTWSEQSDNEDQTTDFCKKLKSEINIGVQAKLNVEQEQEKTVILQSINGESESFQELSVIEKIKFEQLLFKMETNKLIQLSEEQITILFKNKTEIQNYSYFAIHFEEHNEKLSNKSILLILEMNSYKIEDNLLLNCLVNDKQREITQNLLNFLSHIITDFYLSWKNQIIPKFKSTKDALLSLFEKLLILYCKVLETANTKIQKSVDIFFNEEPLLSVDNSKSSSPNFSQQELYTLCQNYFENLNLKFQNFIQHFGEQIAFYRSYLTIKSTIMMHFTKQGQLNFMNHSLTLDKLQLNQLHYCRLEVSEEELPEIQQVDNDPLNYNYIFSKAKNFKKYFQRILTDFATNDPKTSCCMDNSLIINDRSTSTRFTLLLRQKFVGMHKLPQFYVLLQELMCQPSKAPIPLSRQPTRNSFFSLLANYSPSNIQSMQTIHTQQAKWTKNSQGNLSLSKRPLLSSSPNQKQQMKKLLIIGKERGRDVTYYEDFLPSNMQQQQGQNDRLSMYSGFSQKSGGSSQSRKDAATLQQFFKKGDYKRSIKRKTTRLGTKQYPKSEQGSENEDIDVEQTVMVENDEYLNEQLENQIQNRIEIEKKLRNYREKEEVNKEIDVEEIKAKVTKEALAMAVKEDFYEKVEDNDLENINFNVLDIEDVKEKFRIIWVMLKKRDFFNYFQVPMAQFCCFLNKVRYFYQMNQNPFHNFNHAIAGCKLFLQVLIYICKVMHCTYFLSGNKQVQRILTQLEQMSIVFTGLCHDMGHTGHSNLFEINSMSKLAIRYHDKSVLEQFHAALTFKVIQNEESNIFQNAKLADIKSLRSFLIQCILYTDMKEHFALMKLFESKLEDYLKAPNDYFKKDEDRAQFGGFLLHCADFTGPIKPFLTARRWSELCNIEFSTQYSLELQKGLPVTPYYKDLGKLEVLSKAEKGFYKAFVAPLWTLANKYLGDIEFIVKNVLNNINEWEKIEQEQQKIMEEDKEQPEKK